ncbi:MAG: glycosyltransferase family 4 protein [Planctomycetes bacterium]|nr:glycosyltransferase family 4 protein [Planctomycetota bacterium]
MSPAILLLTSQAKTVHSGVGTYARMLLRGLPAAAPEHGLHVATWREEIDPELAGVQWIDLGPRSRRDPTPGRFWSFGRRAAAVLGDRLVTFDVVHCLDARDGHAPGQRPRALAPRLVGTVHDDYAAQVRGSPWHYVGRAADPLRRWLFHRWLRHVERRAYARFDRLLVNSAATAATLQREYGLDRPLWPTTLTIDGATAVAPLRLQGQPCLVFCGGNFYRKGLDTCVRAMAALRPVLPAAQLHVLGSCSSSPRLERLARRLGVAGQVVFHGRLAPAMVAAHLAAADQFVMPSRTEALGLVYLEAFRAGVPVIAGDRGGVVEIVRHGESGLNVPPERPDALAQAIVALHGDGALRARLVAGGHRVLATRPPQRLLEETLRCYGLGPSLAPLPARVLPAAAAAEVRA